MNRQPYLDLDGVLADFDGYYQRCFGINTVQLRKKKLPDPKGFWKNIEENKTFYRDLPILSDARELVTAAKILHPNPIILTGLPRIDYVEKQKREWVKEHFGDMQVICCPSHEKKKYCKLGDVLIDDWDKYKHLWEEAGGIFILHTSAKESIEQLKTYFLV